MTLLLLALMTIPFEVTVPSTPIAARALGRTHLVYEVHVTGAAAISSLAALDAADSKVLGDWKGEDLARRIQKTGDRAVIYVWISLPPGAAIPQALLHRVNEVETARIAVRQTPMALQTMPVGPGRWISVRGPSNTSGHRRSLVGIHAPQRFAVDWALLGADGKLFSGSGDNVNEWYGYDQPVYSATAGRVIDVRDGVADGRPFKPAPMGSFDGDAAIGNAVVIDAGEGRFALYAHLRAGSLRVKQGDNVSAGQDLGRIGNSGHSLAPHLHFQITDGPRPLASEGVPFVLGHFRLIGRIDGLGSALKGEGWQPAPERPARNVVDEMPLENMVIEVSRAQ